MKAKSLSLLNRQILDEASAWFVDFRVGDVDAAARGRFDQWVRCSPEHIRAYMEIARTYVELPSLKSDTRIDVDALIASARADANVVLHDLLPTSISEARPRRRTSLRPRALAACLAIASLAGAAGGWLWLHRYSTYSTEIGENRSITLADGSIIDLNARSQIEVRFSKAERQVDLVEGQALFEVAKDSARPFIVRSDGAVVRAVGTEFDVNRNGSGTTVTVVEGRVAVLSEQARPSAFAPARTEAGTAANSVPPRARLAALGATYVSAGEQVTVTLLAVTQPKQADVAAATAWTQHRLIFDATPLSDVVDDFNRYNPRPLVIDDGALNDFHVSGVYTSTDPASLIRFLREQPGIEVTETDDAVHISRR